MRRGASSGRYTATWNVTKQAVEHATAQAERLGFPRDKRIIFLCAKGVDPNSSTGHSRFELLIDPARAGTASALWERRRNTLHGILRMPTDKYKRGHDEKSIPRKLSFDHFVEQHPQWGAGKSFVFFLLFRF